MKITLIAGDIVEATAAAICTSTNPRLSLMMGTGAAARERGGFDVLRACERIVADYEASTGRRELPAGTVHLTTAGSLPFRGIIHCVASGAAHRSSPDIVRVVVERAVELADAQRFESLAMPVFGTGHAHLRFDRAVTAMGEAFAGVAPANVQEIVVVVDDPERVPLARQLLEL